MPIGCGYQPYGQAETTAKTDERLDYNTWLKREAHPPS